MRRNLVTASHDFAHQRRLPPGDPTQRKKRSARTVFVEQIQQPSGADVDAARARLPRLACHEWREGCDLKVFLDVDSEMMPNSSRELEHASYEPTVSRSTSTRTHRLMRA